MSHVASIKLEVKSLDALRAAVERLGLQFKEGQRTYRWFGRNVGDYPLPEGFRASDLGKCEHAITVPGRADAYEIGVCEKKDGSYQLLWDFWQGGFGLQERVGDDCWKLKQAYGVEVALETARRDGFMANEQLLADGTIEVLLQR